MPPGDPRFDHRLSAIFAAEAAEHVERMHACLAELDEAAPPQVGASKPLQLLFRATHSLKGAARAVGRSDLETVCHAMEGVVVTAQRGRLAWSRETGEALHDAAAALEHGLAATDGQAASRLALALRRLQQFAESQSAPPAAVPASGATAEPPVTQPLPASADGAAPPPPAGELPTAESVRIAAEGLEQLLHGVESLLAIRTAGRQRTRMLADLRASGAHLGAGIDGAREHDAAAARHERQLRSLQAALERDQRHLDGAVDALLSTLKKTLLVPAASLLPIMLATVRELARAQGKEVHARLEGDAIQMDRRVLQEIRGPLLHLLRNAVAHGIEPPDVRERAGKPRRGEVTVTVAGRSGGRAVVTVSDDGAGVDTGRLADAARAAGVDVPPQAGRDELLDLAFGAGVSTAELTHVAGRGIGLAIVRETVERLGGSVEMTSSAGRGTTFTLVLPVSLATMRAVEVRAAEKPFLVPTSQVLRCVRYRRADAKPVGARLTVPLHGERIALASLAAVLGLAAGPLPAKFDCLVLRDGPRRVAIAVDELVGEQEVLGKPVQRSLTTAAIVAGAAVIDGFTVPVLNPAELARIAGAGRHEPAAFSAEAPAARARRSILLAEDSITSRTLLKNILELAGYDVEVAGDGAEALAKLRSGRFDLVVSDIEMPHLDGIALTQAIRADAALAALPVVLVTSLASPADRERGAEAGASAYIVKSSFEQGNLLRAIEELA